MNQKTFARLSLFFIVFCLFTMSRAGDNPNGMTTDRVVITSISTRIDQVNHNAYGSIRGGTLIYLTASGHNRMPSKNSIQVGPYPCEIEENGISGDIISCRTTQAFDMTRRNKQLVVLTVEGKLPSKCQATTGGCKFTYRESTPNTNINWRAVWRVRTSEDITKLKIGEYNCNRFQLEETDEPINLNDDEEISANFVQDLPCQLSPNIPAGFYNVDAEIVYGNFNKRATSQNLSVDGQNQYEFVITADVTDVSSSNGGENGNRLTISGNGFSTDSDNVVVKVGNIDCFVVSITNEQIVCDLESGATSAADSVDGTTTSFLSGTGLQVSHWQFDTTEGLDEYVIDIDTLVTGAIEGTIPAERLVSETILGSWEMQVGDTYAKEGVHARGFFKAPRAGEYKFWLSANDYAQVYLNQTPNDTAFYANNKILNQCSYTDFRNYFYPATCDENQLISDSIVLAEGESYWLQLFLLDNIGAGHFTLSVETPAPEQDDDEDRWVNALDEVQTVEIIPEVQNQRYSIKVYSEEDFQLKFFYYDAATRKTVYNESTAKRRWDEWTDAFFVANYDQTAGHFGAELYEAHKLNAQGERCTDCEAAGREWVVDFTLYRTTQRNIKPECVPSSKCRVQRLQDQADPVSGTYGLTFGGEPIQVRVNEEWTTEIPYNNRASSIRSGLFENIDDDYQNTMALTQGRQEDGYKLTFNFRSNLLKQQMPKFQADASGLRGGAQGSNPEIKVSRMIKSSANPFHQPIPFDMTFTGAQQPQVEVVVNGIPSRCSTNCSYQTDSTLNGDITSFSLSGSTLSLTLTGIQDSATLDDISVEYAGSQCTGLTGTLPNVSCTLSSIEAGESQPSVLVSGQGFLSCSATAETIIPTVSSVSPTAVGTNGGLLVTIEGTGFPIQDYSQVTVTIGGVQAIVQSTSNTSISIITPQQSEGAQDIVVSSFGQDSTAFSGLTYQDTGVATVTNIEPQTASPVIKQDIVITGTNFGTNLSDIQVWLESEEGEQVYQLNVLPSNLADTEITARLGGGHVGTYNLVVYNVIGSSISTGNDNQFKYIIELDSISEQGHDLGGQIITLTGSNFSKVVADNNVFLTDGNYKSQCYVVSCDESEIVVRIPPKNPDFSDNIVDFVVLGRLVEESTCVGQCSFTYTGTDSAPSIDEVTGTIFSVGQTVELTGTNLVVDGQASFQANGQEFSGEEFILVNDDSSITITIPDLPVDSYVFLIYLGNNGLAGGFEGEIQFTAIAVSPNKYGLFGSDITIEGSGFDEDTTVTVNKLNCPVRSFTSSTITCISPIQAEFSDGLIIEVSKPGFDTIEASSRVNVRDNKNVTANTDLSVSNSRNWDVSAVLGSVSPVEYGIHQTKASASFTFSLVDPTENTSGEPIEVFLQSVQNARVRLTGSVNGNTVTFTNTVAGTYRILIQYPNKGFAQIPEGSVWEVEFTLPAFSIASGSTTGLNGGSTLTLSGAGFSEQLESNNVVVCGQLCDVTSSTTTSLECTLPTVNTEYLEELQGAPTTLLTPLFSKSVNQIKSVSTSQSNGSDVSGDWDFTDSYNLINLSSNVEGQVDETECWVQFEAYDDSRILFQSVQWNLNNRAERSRVQQNALYYVFTVEGSNDGTNWEQLAENDPYDKVNHRYSWQQQANFGFGGFKQDETVTPYKYIRAKETALQPRHNTCHYHSVELFGSLQYVDSITTSQDITCDVKTIVNRKSNSLSGAVTYSASSTSIIEEVSPAYVSIVGGDQITITGSNLNNASVFIDGIECNVDTNTNTEIVCTTGRNSSNSVNSELHVLVNEVPAIVQKEVVFFSGLIYSDEINTWNGESVPRDGDSVFVPVGQTLIIDQSNEGVLNTIVVEGTLVFQNGVDIELNAKYIIVRSGKFIVGSKYVPFANRLLIQMHGNYSDIQLPEFGSKVIGCHTCQLEIHGQPKTPTWSTLASTVDVGATSVTLTEGNTNWAVGDEIGIAPTGYQPDEHEKRTITNISHQSGGDVITFVGGLENKHISATETYGDRDLVMEAEIVNLTRNVKFQGNPEDSIVGKYGGHIKVHGAAIDGSLVRISQVEFQYTGQPQIVGRYNVHFHMIGNAIRSSVEGIAVHDSFARIVAVHSVHNLLISRNVGFNNQGHNIFLEDGSETGNVVEYNVVISPLSAFNMLQTDITVAGIWITHPANYVRYNHVAGSQFYGMWYEIKKRVGTHPDVCPMGNIVLQVEFNVAHSNTRFGERFFQLKPRRYPCKSLRDKTAVDPFAANPSVQTIFRGGSYWKNGESGILAEFVGNSIFQDYMLADNYRTGFQTHTTNFTAEQVIFQNSLVVGETVANGGQPEDAPFETSAILMPRTDGFLARNIDIHNFPAGFNIIESSSENQFLDLWTQGGYQADVEQLTLTNCENAGFVKWQGGPLRNLVWDKDGSLTGTGVPTWITPYYNFHQQLVTDNLCTRNSDKYNIESVACSRPLRGLKIGALEKKEQFVGQSLRVFNLNDETYAADFGTESEDYDQFVKQTQMKIKNPALDLKYGFTTILATGYTYNLHWNEGIDFSHALIFPSYQQEADDLTTILRFNYTETRELFDIYRMIGGELVESLIPETDLSKFVDNNNVPNSGDDSCTFGQHFNDEENQFLYLCINAKTKDTTFEQIDITGVYCRDTCSSGFDCPSGTEKQAYKFDPTSNSDQYNNQDTQQPMVKTPGTEQWQYGTPQQGDDFLVPCNWVLNFNMAEWEFGTLIIDGTFKIDESLENVHIKATNIWVRGGNFIAGRPDALQAYTKNLTIELVGNRDSIPLLIDDISRTGTKSLAVTSQLELYGVYPSTTQTRLTATVNTGDNQITVQDDIADWKVGDEIVLGAANLDGLGYEKHTIATINVDTKTITLEGTIAEWHYGHPYPTVSPSVDSEVTVDEKFGGDLDMRTVVGHITRNIKIIGSDEESWGGHLQVYHYVFDDEEQGIHIDARGSAILQGVEFSNMGQHQTENAGLHILYTNLERDDRLTTVVNGSSFHDCFGFCLNGYYADLVTVQNTVFYKGEKFLIQALEGKQWTITDNLFIGVTLKQGGADLEETQGVWDPVALIHMYTPYLPSVEKHEVRRNVGSGSEGIGFAFPGTPCEESAQNQFTDNEVGFVSFTGVLFNLKENRCYSAGHIQVFQSREGLTLNMSRANDGYQAEKIMIAECKRDLILHSASDNHIVHNNYLKDTWVSAYVRTQCEDCYTQDKNRKNTMCSKVDGIQLHVTTEGGESFPWVKSPFVYDVICTPPAVYGSMFLDDVELHNFRKSYDSAEYPFGGECGNNTGFKNHQSAASASAGHYLNNVKCTDCDHDALFFIMDEKDGWAGWFGGCGIDICTGLSNIIVQDLTGDLLGHKGTVIGHNESIGDSLDECQWVPTWNTYDCVENLDLGVLEWNSEGADKQELSPIPVFVTNDDYSNKINMWREWEWQGPEPLNERLNRFSSLIMTNQWHNITYSGSQSVNLVYKLQQRKTVGENDRYVIIKTHYPNPLALEIRVKGELIKPFPFSSSEDLNQHTTTCGANNYFYDNSTLHFVVTNVPDCQVQVRQVNQVFVNMVISMTSEEFYSDDAKQTDFTSRISAFLNIPTDQVRIVGLSDSRRILEESEENITLQVVIAGEEPSNVAEGYDPAVEYQKLKAQADSLIEGANTQDLDLGVGVEEVYYNIIVLRETGNQGQDENDFFNESDLDNSQNGTKKVVEKKEEKDSTLVIALSIIFSIIGVILISMISYHMWKKKQVKSINDNLQIPASEIYEKSQVKVANQALSGSK